MNNRYLHTSFLPYDLVKLFEVFDGCGRVSIKLKSGSFGGVLLPVIVSYCCKIPERKDVYEA